jgi:putative transcriptional regulator
MVLWSQESAGFACGREEDKMAINVRLDQVIREKQAEWERDITYREISETTGLAESTIARLKAGSKGIRFDVLDRLCKFLGVVPGDLLEYVPDSSEELPGQ